MPTFAFVVSGLHLAGCFSDVDEQQQMTETAIGDHPDVTMSRRETVSC